MMQHILPASLWLAGAFNLIVAGVLAAPDSAPGRMLDLPPQVPALYMALSTMFVALFGVMYLWLAVRGVDRSLLCLGALGKLCAFALAGALWQSGDAAAPLVLAASGDLVLGALWLAWLAGSR